MWSLRLVRRSISLPCGVNLRLILVLAPLYIALASNSALQAQTYKLLYTFGDSPDGAAPIAGLVRDFEGNLYGTTADGGANGYGTVFKLDRCGKETVLYSFAGGLDGSDPQGGVALDWRGNLYGTTATGGYDECPLGDGCGTVYKVDRHGNHTVLYRFGAPPDGNTPYGSVVLDEIGNIYGTTSTGGDPDCDPGVGCGTVFKLDKEGRETTLHVFTGVVQLDGAIPYAGLLRDWWGNMYGTTTIGGAPGCDRNMGCGSVFKLDRKGHETILHRFSGLDDGIGPEGDLFEGFDGNLYGTTTSGGFGGYGTVFKLDRWNRETVLYSFSYGTMPTSPYAGVVRDAKGNLYGTTVEGGSYFDGTVFKLDKTGSLTILQSFNAGPDGGFPRGALTLDDRGNLYGTATGGGNPKCNGDDGCGVIFEITQAADSTSGENPSRLVADPQACKEEEE